jgi:hypothetical protein
VALARKGFGILVESVSLADLDELGPNGVKINNLHKNMVKLQRVQFAILVVVVWILLWK